MKRSLAARYPLLLPFLAYLSGLVTDILLQPDAGSLLVIAIVVLIFLAAGFYPGLYMRYNRSHWFGYSLLLLMFNVGILNHQFFRAVHQEQSQSKAHLIRVDRQPEQRKKSLMLRGTVLDTGKGFSLGSILLFMHEDEASRQLCPGDIIVLRKKIYRPGIPVNPGEFDYGKYLATRGILYHAFAGSDEWKLLRQENLFSITNLALSYRAAFLDNIAEWPVDEDSKSLAKALLLGERKAIDPRQLEQYASAGAMHILAVSGLHTGVFYLVLSLLIRPVHRLKYGKAASAFLIIIFLWCYAFITGLSASVVRAVCMFSLMAIGTSLQRRISIYNSVLASAFILLLIWPGYISQVGFQLSYAAILGIVSLQAFFSKALGPGNYVVRRIWDLVSVSIAAQIATLPLALYYFHQFPSLFIITNLLVIPLVTLLMYLGLFCLALSLLQWTIIIPFRLFEFLVNFMNTGVSFIDSAGIHLTGIHITTSIAILLYALVLLCFRWWKLGKFQNLKLTGLVILLILLLNSFRWVRLAQPQLYVYNVKRHAALGLFHHKAGVLLADSTLLTDSTTLEYKIRGHWLERGIQNPELLDMNRDTIQNYYVKHGPLLFFGDKWYLLYGQNSTSPAFADTWIITSNLKPPAAIERIPEKVVISSAVSHTNAAKWVSWCEQNECACWDVSRQGFWTDSESIL